MSDEFYDDEDRDEMQDLLENLGLEQQARGFGAPIRFFTDRGNEVVMYPAYLVVEVTETETEETTSIKLTAPHPEAKQVWQLAIQGGLLDAGVEGES